MALLAEHALLYSLRSPTTPLADKVASASSALDAAPGNISLAATVRDWALDALLRAARQQAADAGPATILDAGLWQLAARTTEATVSTSPVAASTLPIFVAFVTQYSQATANVELLKSAASAWSRLATNAMRKATADASLDGYERLLEASLRVFARDDAAGADDEQEVWTELAVNWLKPFRSVVLEAGKGGKKVRCVRSLPLGCHKTDRNGRTTDSEPRSWPPPDISPPPLLPLSRLAPSHIPPPDVPARHFQPRKPPARPRARLVHSRRRVLVVTTRFLDSRL
jgi:hypothetical protein